MHSDIRRGLAMLVTANQFGVDRPLNPPNARATVLFGEVRHALSDIQEMGGLQESHRRGFLSAAKERQFLAQSMRTLMRQIARVAKFLPAEEYPGAREKLQVPRSNGYTVLLVHAEVFLRALPSMKAGFIERGMPADFDLRLRELMTQLEAVARRRNSARAEQVGNTAGMKARLREAVRAVRELDVILSLLLQNDPAAYAAWRSASHIERAPRRSLGGGTGESSGSPAAAGQSGVAMVTGVAEVGKVVAPVETRTEDPPPPVPGR